MIRNVIFLLRKAKKRRNGSNEASAEVGLLFRRVMLVLHEPALHLFAKIAIGLARARCSIYRQMI